MKHHMHCTARGNYTTHPHAQTPSNHSLHHSQRITTTSTFTTVDFLYVYVGTCWLPLYSLVGTGFSVDVTVGSDT